MPLAWQGIYIALLSALLIAWPLNHIEPIFRLLQLDEATTRIAQGYLSALSWGMPAVLIMTALRGLTDGLGHTRIIMVFSLLSSLLCVSLCLGLGGAVFCRLAMQSARHGLLSDADVKLKWGKVLTLVGSVMGMLSTTLLLIFH